MTLSRAIRKLLNFFVYIFRVYGIFFCILSVGYFFNIHVFHENLRIAFTFDYILHIFIEGVLVVAIGAISALCIMNSFKLAVKNEDSEQNRSDDRNTQK